MITFSLFVLFRDYLFKNKTKQKSNKQTKIENVKKWPPFDSHNLHDNPNSY